MTAKGFGKHTSLKNLSKGKIYLFLIFHKCENTIHGQYVYNLMLFYIFILCITGITGNVHLGEAWGSCPMTMVMNGVTFCGTVIHGEARILQPMGSDVSLKISAGFRGVYRIAVHIDHLKFKGLQGIHEKYIGAFSVNCGQK